MKAYKEFIITADPFNADLLSGLLWELDIAGINEEEDCLKVFAGYENPLCADDIIQQLKKLQIENLLNSFTVRESVVEEKNWNEEWEKSLNVIKVSDKIVIKPSFKEYEKINDEIVITIDPKMSFGTGEHATTKLIVHLLEKYIEPGMKILDVGTGTGILSIISVRLGASKVIGFDIDEWCCENAQENTIINDVSGKAEIRMGEINVIPESDFDIILANIQKNILLDLLKDFSVKLNKGGFVLLSGLLEEDEEKILQKYTKEGFRHLETRQLDEWIAVAFTKM
jgi:ribosomal protein L11 methyltransferase